MRKEGGNEKRERVMRKGKKRNEKSKEE